MLSTLRQMMKTYTTLLVPLILSFIATTVPVTTRLIQIGDSPVLQVTQNKVQPKELNEECGDCQPRPLAQDLDVRQLTKLLGGHLDTTVVSLTKPKSLPQTVQKVSLNSISKAERRHIRSMVRRGARNMADFKGTISHDVERFLMGWLLQQARCPLNHYWRDMGPYFWPRFVKRAYCVGKPCSVMPFVRCKPSDRRVFPLLRWHCLDSSHANYLSPWSRRGAVWRSGYVCRWVKFSYPITIECSCACASKLARQ